MSKILFRTPGNFRLTDSIRARRTLRFAKKHGGLSFRQQMALGKANKLVVSTFAIAA